LIPLAPSRRSAVAQAIAPVALALLLSAGGARAGTIVLGDDRDQYRVGALVDLLEDPTGERTIEDVAGSEAAPQFRPSTSDVPRFGLTAAAYWARLRIEDRCSRARGWRLEIGFAPLDVVELYVREASGSFRVKRAGFEVPFDQWEIDHRNPTFTLPLESGATAEIYLRVRGQYGLELPLTIWAENAFWVARLESGAVLSVLYGGLLVLVLYGLSTYVAVRDVNYVRYALMTLGLVVYLAGFDGFLYQYVLPDVAGLASRVIPTTGIVAGFCFLVFTRTYLETRKHAPRIDRFLIGVSVLQIALLVLAFVTSPLTLTWLAIPIGVANIAGCSAAAAVAWRKGHAPARSYVAGAGVAILGGVLQWLRPLGLPSNLLTENALRVGAIVSSVVLALGVPRRLFVVKKGFEESTAEKEKLLDEVQTLNRTLEDRVRSRTAEVEAVDRRKTEFLAKMSHELRTPLNAVMGFSEVLIDGTFGEMNEKQREYLRDIHSSGEHLLSLLNDILDLSKIETGKIELELARFDLSKAIDNALVLIRERAMLRGVRVAMEMKEGIGEVVADQRKVKQVLINLLTNAVKFTDAGSIVVSAELDGAFVEVQVHDTGIGITPEQKERIFEAFWQAEQPITRRAGGTGLGLTISRRLLDLLGGEMKVTSEPGQGSTFTARIPLQS
jgi:two-component system, sensor histidine kinase LadS